MGSHLVPTQTNEVPYTTQTNEVPNTKPRGSLRPSWEEMLALAEWVWCSFRPGKSISDQDRVTEACWQ